MESAKNVADWTKVDPFVAIHAEKMLLRACNSLSIHNEVARGYSQDWNGAKDHVANHKAFWLGFEQFFVEHHLVLAHERQVGPVNHVVIAVEIDVVGLVDQYDGYDGEEVFGIDLFMAILHPEGRDEEPDGDRVHRDAEDLVECT